MNQQNVKTELTRLINEALPIIKSNNQRKDFMEALFYSVLDKPVATHIAAFTYSEFEIIEAPVKYLFKLKEVSEKYSYSYIKSQIISLYHQLLTDKITLKECLNKILTNLDNSPEDFFIISEIENIRIIDDLEYEIVDSVIKILKEEDLPFKKDQFKTFLKDMDIGNKPCIWSRVKAGDMEKAKELAFHNFLVSFNLLRLYAPVFKPLLKGHLLTGKHEFIVFNKTKNIVSSNISTLGTLRLNHAYLNKDFYDNIKIAGIEQLKFDSLMSKVTKESLYWFGLGLEEKYPAASLVNFVTVLEAILKKKDEKEEIQRAIAERGSILLYNKFEQRKEAVKQLKLIYDARSKIVHTGALNGDKDLSNLAGNYAKAILIKFISKIKYFDGDFKKFIDNLDDTKLKG